MIEGQRVYIPGGTLCWTFSNHNRQDTFYLKRAITVSLQHPVAAQLEEVGWNDGCYGSNYTRRAAVTLLPQLFFPVPPKVYT